MKKSLIFAIVLSCVSAGVLYSIKPRPVTRDTAMEARSVIEGLRIIIEELMENYIETAKNIPSLSKSASNLKFALAEEKNLNQSKRESALANMPDDKKQAYNNAEMILKRKRIEMVAKWLVDIFNIISWRLTNMLNLVQPEVMQIKEEKSAAYTKRLKIRNQLKKDVREYQKITSLEKELAAKNQKLRPEFLIKKEKLAQKIKTSQKKDTELKKSKKIQTLEIEIEKETAGLEKAARELMKRLKGEEAGTIQEITNQSSLQENLIDAYADPTIKAQHKKTVTEIGKIFSEIAKTQRKLPPAEMRPLEQALLQIRNLYVMQRLFTGEEKEFSTKLFSHRSILNLPPHDKKAPVTTKAK